MILRCFALYRLPKPYLVGFIPVALFYSLLIRFGQNIPTADDFQASLNFVYAFFFTNKTLQEQWQLLFSQHNEHRILVSRLITLTLYRLTGRINLLTILWIQQLFWLAFVVLIFLIGRSMRLWKSGWHGLPVVFLLFHPNTYDTLLNVWGGSQTYPTLLFMVTSLYALQRSNIRSGRNLWYGIAIIAAGLATFSFASGLLVWVGGTVYLFFCRRFPAMLGWFLVGGLLTGFYLWQFERPHSTSLPIPAGFPYWLSTIKFAILFPGVSFMAVWPSPTAALPNLLVCYGIGLSSWVYGGRLLLSDYGTRNPLLFSLLTLSLGTCLLLSLGRGGQGTIGALTSRYQLFANLIPLAIYLILIERRMLSVRQLYAISLLLCLVQIQTVRQSWPVLANQYTKNELGLAQWMQYRTPTLAIEASQQGAASERLEHCIKSNIFRH